MSRIIIICALAGILSVPAKADETLKWRIVQHYTSNQNQQVGDVDRHVMGGCPFSRDRLRLRSVAQQQTALLKTGFDCANSPPHNAVDSPNTRISKRIGTTYR
jgi:hypothetical protein